MSSTWLLTTVAVLAGIAILNVVIAKVLKRVLVGVVPIGLRFRTAVPGEYPSLDRQALREYTDAFTALGFEVAAEFTFDAEAGRTTPGYARLFVHQGRGCYAEVNQLFPTRGPAVTMRCVLVSALDEGWSLATTDREVDGVTYMLRRPKSLWVSRPGAPPAVLSEEHLALRERVRQDLGLPEPAAPTVDAYFARLDQENRAMRDVLARRSLYASIADAFLFSRQPKWEWMGEYAARRSR
jgi:hypothetical protein